LKLIPSSILTFLVVVANATERVNVACKFDAVAAGYVSKVYSTNLILEKNRLYNADGSSGNNRNAIFGNGDDDYKLSFQIFDGNEYRRLSSGDGLKYNIFATWTLNTGEVTCVMTRGWGSSYYSDNIKTVHDTVYISHKFDVRPDSANVFWNPNLRLWSLVSNEEIAPKNGEYCFYYASNEERVPK